MDTEGNASCQRYSPQERALRNTAGPPLNSLLVT